MNQHDYDAQKHNNDAGQAPMGSVDHWNSVHAANLARGNAELAREAERLKTGPTDYSIPSTTNPGMYTGVYTGPSRPTSWGAIIVFLMFAYATYFVYQYKMAPTSWLTQGQIDESYIVPVGVYGFKQFTLKEQQNFKESNLSELANFKPIFKPNTPFEKMFEGCSSINACLGVNYMAFKKLEPYALNPSTYWSDVCTQSYLNIYSKDLPVSYKWSVAQSNRKDKSVECTPLNKRDVEKAISDSIARTRMWAITLAALVAAVGAFVLYRMNKAK